MAQFSILTLSDFLFRIAGDGYRAFLLVTVVLVYLQLLAFTRRGL